MSPVKRMERESSTYEIGKTLDQAWIVFSRKDRVTNAEILERSLSKMIMKRKMQ